MRLSRDDVRQIRKALESLTPGEYEYGPSVTKTVDEAAAFAADCVRKRDSPTLWFVHIPDTGEGGKLIAMTGNGPNAERNAHGMAALIRAIPFLLDDWETMRGQLEGFDETDGP